MTKSVTFRLSESDVELLESIAAERNSSKTDAIRHALQQAKKALHNEAREEVRGEGGGSKVLDVLTEQLRVKDVQIAELSRALERAQTLHHEEREPRQLETAEVRKTRWERFKEKWLWG